MAAARAKKTTTPVTTQSKTTVVENAADILEQLGSLVETPTTPKGKAVWEITLTGEEAEELLRYTESYAVSEVVSARLDNSKDMLSTSTLRKIAETFFKQKGRPANPRLRVLQEESKTVDCSCIFQMQDRFKDRWPEVPADCKPRDFYIKTLVDLGLHPTDAANFVDNEIDFNPVIGLRDLDTLLRGSYVSKRNWVDATPEEQSAGKKLAAFLMGKPDASGNVTLPALTNEERNLIVDRSNKVRAKSGFYERVTNYVHSVEQLQAIFSVMQPVAFPSGVKFAENDTPESRTKRLIEAAADILGVATTSPD